MRSTEPTRPLRAAIRNHGLGCVLAVSANRRVPTPAGAIRVDQLPAHLPRRAWQKHSAGTGSHGQRYYAWAWIALLAEDDADTGRHYLLIRRNDTTGELAYLRCYSPWPVTLHALVKPTVLLTAASHPARPCQSGRSTLAYRGIVPSRQRPHRAGSTPGPALDLLASVDHPGHARACLPGRGNRDRTDSQPTPTGLITLTVNEFRRLFDALLLTTRHTITSLLAWSRWRRQHQYRARLSHYRQRENQ
jgi:hypothetical protein